MSFIHVSPYQYELQSVKIESGRTSGFYEVASSVMEINLYEHLEKPYISATLLLLDDANIFENIDFLGTERVDIQIKIPGSSEIIRRQFVVREIENTENLSDQSQVLLLSLVDSEFYLSSLINLQKKYQGKPNEIITNCIVDNFPEKNLLMRDAPIQAPIRFLVPNMNPFQVMMAMRDRSTDAMGSPFFLYPSLADQDLRFFSLHDMLDRPALNSSTQPYRYSQVFASNDQLAPAASAYNITSMEYRKNENTNQLVRNGDVGAVYQYHDPISNLTSAYNHNIKSIYQKLYSASSVIAQAPLYDHTTTINGRPLHDYLSKNITNIAVSRTFEGVNNYHEDNSDAFHRDKSVGKALKNFLMKSTIDITVPGGNFLTSKANVTIGNQITIQALKNFVPDGKNSDLTDKKKSGNYLIYAARHTFSQGQRYEVSLTAGKLGNLTGTTYKSLNASPGLRI